jgi:hypothetical protein
VLDQILRAAVRAETFMRSHRGQRLFQRGFGLVVIAWGLAILVFEGASQWKSAVLMLAMGLLIGLLAIRTMRRDQALERGEVSQPPLAYFVIVGFATIGFAAYLGLLASRLLEVGAWSVLWAIFVIAVALLFGLVGAVMLRAGWTTNRGQ